jgi:thiol:disulfide interchange protein DsbA
MKRALLLLMSWTLTAFALGAHAADPQAGKHYTMVNPSQPSSTAGKIEVLEFFSYGCPHCKDINPLLHDWAAKQPKDVVVRRVPVTFGRPAWARLAKIYYALEATGNLDKLDNEVFKALHDQRINFATDESVVQWVASKGVDAKKFADAMNGFSIQSQVQRGDQAVAAYHIGGVPSLAVDGRFLLKNEAAANSVELLQFTDALINQARNEQRKK